MPFVKLDAFEKFRSAQNEKIRELVERLTGVDETLTKLEAALAELEEKPAEPEEPGEPGIPNTVYDATSLKAFVVAKFGADYLNSFWVNGEEKKTAIRQVRNALAAAYPYQIKLLQSDPAGVGYSAPLEKHSDAFWYVPSAVIIDFAIASDAPGSLADCITWNPTFITPW